MKRGVLIILFCGLSVFLFSQDSCFRFTVRPYNIIQNPSFELGTLPCMSGFVNQFGLTIPFWTTFADEMPTAYLNSCTNFVIPDSIFEKAVPVNRYVFLYPIVPQPIPDGNGVVAVTDFGFDGGPHEYPKHKSYVSTCLPVLLEKDSLFRLEFYVGFGNKTANALVTNDLRKLPELSPSPEKFSIFGLDYCQANPQPVVGCPEVAGWVILGSVTVRGKMGTWVKTHIDFKALQNIQSIALGPSCDTTRISPQGTFKWADSIAQSNNYSYFLDNLQMYKANVPIPVINMVAGSFCNKTVTLGLSPDFFDSGFNLQWSKNGTILDNEHNKTLTITTDAYSEGVYQCRVENDNVCLASNTIRVNWLTTPQKSVLGGSDTTACSGETILLNAFIDSSIRYSWQDGSTLPQLAVEKTGTYVVTMSNECGTALAQKTVLFKKCKNEIYVPNAFTPNGDGLNDIFKVHYSNPPAQYEMRIYNRYGQQLFVSSAPSEGWDGTIRGVKQPSETYVWFIEYRDYENVNHRLKGTIVLIR